MAPLRHPWRLLLGLTWLAAAIGCGPTTVPSSTGLPPHAVGGSSGSATGTTGLMGSSTASSSATTSSADSSTGAASTSSSGTGTSAASSSSGTSTASTTSSSGATSSSSSGSTGACPVVTAPATVVQAGTSGYRLIGQVVTPDQSFAGEVLVVGDSIACVDVDCSGASGASSATVIQTNGIILPGLIDTHNHILYNIFDESDWTPSQVYADHNQWTSEPRYQALVNAKQYLNGEGASPVNYNCEMEKYGELKALISGTTSVVTAANPANKSCYGTLARTIDQSPNGLGSDHIQVATLFPSSSTANSVCDKYADGGTAAYLVHIAEGTDSSALNEFGKLGSITTPPNCLYAPQTTIVHGVALGSTELATMAQYGMNLTWSPRSNVFLYGGGTDLTKTADIPLALADGINVSLAPDWSIGGSVNLLDELRFAQEVDHDVWADAVSPKQLTEMVTSNPARALGLGATLGQLAPGYKADLVVIDGDPAAPYDALLAASPREVRLVMVGGEVLYGDAALGSVAQSSPACDAVDVCCRPKFLCAAQPGATSTNLFAETYADILGTLQTALADYDSQADAGYVFSPIAPLVQCR